MEIESGAAQAAEARVDQEQIAQSAPAHRPGRVEPAQIDGQAEHEENDRIPPGAPLLRISRCGLLQQPGHRDRQQSVQG